MGADRPSNRCWTAAAIGAALLAASCTTPSAMPEGGPVAGFGWIDGNCIAVKSPFASLPRKVWLVTEGSASQAVAVEAVARAEASAAGADSGCHALHPDRAEQNLAQGNVFYTISGFEPANFAIVALEEPEAALQYDYCFTAEGVNFSVSDGQRVVWEDYYYLGYDVEPTCN